MSRSKRPSAAARATKPQPRPASSARTSSVAEGLGTPAPLDAATAARAATALAVLLVVLLLARGILVFVPSMAAWGVNIQRFLPFPAAWLPWTIAAVALVPAFARRAQPTLEAIGNATARGPIAPALWMALAAAIVLWLPDNAFFTGDLLLRRRAIEEGKLPQNIFPQALPLDVLIHFTIPRELFLRAGFVASDTARLWGALDAAALAAAAVAFVRALRFAGAAAFAVTASIVFGGTLALCTGYGKSLAELAVLAVAIPAFGARVVREDRGHLALGVAVALAIALHRSGLVFLPAALAAWALAARTHGISRRMLAGLALPLLATAIVIPRVITLVRTYDVANNVVGVNELGGPRALDLVNAFVLVAPLALCAPVLIAAFGRGLPRRAEIVPLAVLTVTLMALAIVVHPLQGVVRDWDVIAPSGVAVAVIAAWLVGETLRGAPRHAWLALAVAFAAAMPSLQWLVHMNGPRLALARVEAVLSERPARSDLERARLIDWIGIRNAWLDDWNAAAVAFERSAELLPTPRVLDQWGRAELRTGDWEGARRAYRRMIERDPNSLTAWRGFATAVTRMDAPDSARLAAENLLRIDPADRDAKAILEYLDGPAAAE